MRDYSYNSSLNMPYYKVKKNDVNTSYLKFKNGKGMLEVAGLDKTLESLRTRYIDMQESMDSAIEMRVEAEKELAELKAKRKEEVRDEYVKQLEADLAEEREERKHSFVISDEEWNKMVKWQEDHIAERHSYIDADGKKQAKLAGAIGGRFRYIFVPTSIGIFATCKCSCGEELNIGEEL